MLKTNILQPQSHSNSQTTFRIPSSGKVIMSNFRLINFGCTVTEGDGNENFVYNAGAYALLKSVRLYSGNTLLDQCQKCNQIAGFNMLKGSTDDLYDIQSVSACTNLNIRKHKVEYVDAEYETDLQLLNNKLRARIELSRVLNMLNSIDYFASWPDLRVELEYHSNPALVLATSGNPGAFTVHKPELVFEDMVDEEMKMEAMKEQAGNLSLQWFCWEPEVINNLGNGFQSVRVRAFDNKLLNQVVVMTQFLNSEPLDNLGACYSEEFDQQTNFMLNGKRLLPLNGHNCSARRGAECSDLSLVGVCVPNIAVLDDNGIDFAETEQFSESLQELYTSLAFGAVEINQVVNRLDLELTRSADYAANYSCLLWGSVMKFLTKSPSGQFVVGYQVPK